jgi:hypothetical protein
MLSDRDLGNHRLALTTLNSAIHNKMNIILPHLSELLPAVFGDTQVKPELIREVQMGPFKHKVDDGLELRKVCDVPLLHITGRFSFTELTSIRAPTKHSTRRWTPRSLSRMFPSFSTVS